MPLLSIMDATHAALVHTRQPLPDAPVHCILLVMFTRWAQYQCLLGVFAHIVHGLLFLCTDGAKSCDHVSGLHTTDLHSS